MCGGRRIKPTLAEFIVSAVPSPLRFGAVQKRRAKVKTGALGVMGTAIESPWTVNR